MKQKELPTRSLKLVSLVAGIPFMRIKLRRLLPQN